MPRAESDAGRGEAPPTPSPSELAVERDAVHRAVTAFIETVLNGKNIDRIRERYLIAEQSDTEARDAFIASLSGRRDVSVHGQQDPPPPTIAGTRASATTRITRAVRRTLKRDETEQLTLHAELAKSANGWEVTGFRIVPAGAIRP